MAYKSNLKNRRREYHKRKKIKKFLFFPLLFILIYGILTQFLNSEKSIINQISGVSNGAAVDSLNSISKENSSTFKKLEKMSRLDSRVRTILEHSNQYPKNLLDLLANNPDTIDFVSDYNNGLHQINRKTIDISKECRDTNKIPLFLQWDKRWGYLSYGNDMIALNGCGPTCLSMVIVGLTQNKKADPATIADFSEKNNYLSKNSSTKWSLMSEGSKNFGIFAKELPLVENRIKAELQLGHPIICSMGSGDFTTTGHFIVLHTYTKDNKILVNDPNSIIRSKKSWTFSNLAPQIKNLWAFYKK